MGSTGKETFRIQWQVLHSKVRSSAPRLPGEIRANPILCLQVGHDGRSAMEVLITTQHSEPTIGAIRSFGLYAYGLCPTKFWHNSLEAGSHTKKSELVPQVTGGCVTGTALALKPPYPRRAGSCLFGSTKPRVSRFRASPHSSFICGVTPLSLRVGAISPSSQSCS